MSEAVILDALLFHPGQIVGTPGVAKLINGGADFGPLLKRHLDGDWGELDMDDLLANSRALRDGARLLSAYDTEHGRIWILTEAEDDDGKRERTTLLLPEEY